MSKESKTRPDVAVLHTDLFSPSDFSELKVAVEKVGLSFTSVSRKAVPQAGIEWLLPTAVVAYFAKPYFDGILQEIGKDHYAAIKAALKPLWFRLLGPTSPKMVRVGPRGPIEPASSYSLVYSIVAEAPPAKIQTVIPFRPIRNGISASGRSILQIPD